MPLTREEIEELLAEPHLCHFATVDAEGRPRVRPLWFLWRDGEFWFTTRRQARHTGRDLAGGRSVAVSIATEDEPYRALVALGEPEILPAERSTLAAIASRYGEGGEGFADGAMTQPDRVLLRMRPHTILSWNYAREETDGPKRTQV
jgi:nitroimidazol reductase NimA-like FMN-containing flavoprotein (pyridoxamine 5'-phosphate oxidase superfamily)